MKQQSILNEVANQFKRNHEIFGLNIKWQAQFADKVVEILKNNAQHLIDFRIATLEEDTKRCTDLVLHVHGGDIALRLRRPDCLYRDWTIRTRVFWNGKTEIDKLREGFADHYFYAWTNYGNIICEWILIDLDTVRSAGILATERRYIPNGDGTSFWAIPQSELRFVNAIVADSKIDLQRQLL